MGRARRARGLEIVTALRRAVGGTPLYRLVTGTRPAGYLKRRWFEPVQTDPHTVACVKAHGLTLHIPGPLARFYLYGEFEPQTVAWLLAHSTRGAVVADVGAHIGFLTLLMAREVGREGKVHAIEPAADNLALLRLNLEANHADNVELHPVAAGAERAERVLNLSDSGLLHSFYAPAVGAAHGGSAVLQVRLDDVVEGRLDLVKIDVEGAELEVLEGMGRLLGANAGLSLMVEWNPGCQEQSGHSPSALPERLEALGFSVQVLDDMFGRTLQVPEALAELDRGDLPDAWYANLACERTGPSM